MRNVIEWGPREAIKEFLKQDGQSRKWLAEEIGLTETQLSRFLNGKTRAIEPELMGVIAKLQGRPVNWYYELPEIELARVGSLPWFTKSERRVIDVMSTWEWFARPIDIQAEAWEPAAA